MNTLCFGFCLAYFILERKSVNKLFEIGLVLAHLKDKLQPIRDIG
jgi:hypothetical protein